MTSEAIEESGVKAFMSAVPLGTGRARWRFESIPADTTEPEGMIQPKTGPDDGRQRWTFTIPLRFDRGNPGSHSRKRILAECVREASVAPRGREQCIKAAPDRQRFLKAKCRY